MKRKHITIGIIGTGRFATILKKLFEREEEITILQSSRTQPIDHKNIFPLEEVVNCTIVFPAVPISTMQTVLKKCTTFIKPDNNPLFVSICSVMEKPEQWMQKSLPTQVDILITHPVFGPDSTKQGTVFTNLPFVWNPIRIHNQERLKKLQQVCIKRGLNIITMSSKKHDEMMARSQALSFLFGTIGLRLRLQPTSLDTQGFTAILQNQTIVNNDSHELFLNIFQYNTHAKHILQKTHHILDEIICEVGGRQHE